MRFQYKMAHIPLAVAVNRKMNPEATAVAYLEKEINDYADDGWEFFRFDTITVEKRMGCFLFWRFMDLFREHEPKAYCIATFRKPVES